MPIELTITTGGIFNRGLSATADGLPGAACPIELLQTDRSTRSEVPPTSDGE